MPIYEADCMNCTHTFEFFTHRRDDPPPPCPRCGQQARVRDVQPFRIVWVGPVGGRYADKRKEEAHEEWHIAWRVRSSLSGKPEPVIIDSWQKQREFCKEEGLYDPREVPSCGEV